MAMTTGAYHGFESAGSATRPVIRGRHLVVSCGHYLAALAGMRMRELGGNAVDAGVAMVFAQTLLEFQSCGFGGEAPILIYSAAERRVVAINGNMRAPGAATIEWFRARGIAKIPGDGFLPAGVCATPGALLTALDRYGRLSLREVLAPAMELAHSGFPMYESMRGWIVQEERRFRTEWPSSAALFLPGGVVPAVGETWRNPDLAATFERLVEAEHDARSRGRSAALRAARDRFYRGDIAREIVAFQRETHIRDQAGYTGPGLLTEDDFASYETRIEAPVSVSYRGCDVFKCPSWSQGPVFLQQLNLLEGIDLRALGHNSADYLHAVIEAGKLAFADRERYYGDPDFAQVPMTGLLSKEYASARRALIDFERASMDQRPGDPFAYEGRAGVAELTPGATAWDDGTTGTRAADAEGNLFSATPSGGWFRSSPIIPGLGFVLGTRGQMFWLHDPEHPAALRPRKQPRTTLSPSLVMRNGRPWLVFGTPGGDQQDQWTLQFFLNVVDFGMDLQDAVDAPSFHSEHAPSSFYPREPRPGEVVVEARVAPAVLDDLRARGHVIKTVPGWSLNLTTAVAIDQERGVIEGAASSRGERNYALGW
jgi:gamma-glutamyltranspeptidase/glutathione hydrolase